MSMAENSPAPMPAPMPAPGCSCAGCSFCCKLLGIAEITKPAGRWCQECAVGEGCGIYATRPAECRTFNCAWLTDPSLPEEWAPKHSRLVVASSKTGIMVHPDAGRANAWRKDPFYKTIRKWAAALAPRGGQVLVREGAEFFAILPDRE